MSGSANPVPSARNNEKSNDMETLKTAIDWLTKLETLPAGLLTIVACIALGYILKLVPEIPNKRIPLANFVFGSLLYMLITPYTAANPLIVEEGVPIVARLRALAIGMVLSAVAWLIHAQVLKRVENSDFLARVSPGLSNLLASSSQNPPEPPAAPQVDPPKAP